MKKSVAVASASALGLGVVALSPTAAVGAPVTVPCADASEHEYSTAALGDNWFMDCIPQYGMGKAEFTISSTDPLPPEFLPLDDPGVASTYSGNAAAASAYFFSPLAPNGFVELSTDPDIYSYVGKPIFPITGVGAIDPTTLPSGCEAGTYDYANAYSVSYAPITVTFTQVIDGVEWSVEITYTPQTMVLGMNFTAPFDGTLDWDEAQCISTLDSSSGVFIAPGTSASTDRALFTSWAMLTENSTLPPHPSLLATLNFGDFVVQQNAIPAPPGPGLADTGAEVSPFVIGLGAVALLGGAGLFVASRVQKRRRDSA